MRRYSITAACHCIGNRYSNTIRIHFYLVHRERFILVYRNAVQTVWEACIIVTSTAGYVAQQPRLLRKKRSGIYLYTAPGYMHKPLRRKGDFWDKYPHKCHWLLSGRQNMINCRYSSEKSNYFMVSAERLLMPLDTMLKTFQNAAVLFCHPIYTLPDREASPPPVKSISEVVS